MKRSFLKYHRCKLSSPRGFQNSKSCSWTLDLTTKCTSAAHKHIFTSFPNTVIPFQIDTQVSQITISLGTFPDWSLLSLKEGQILMSFNHPHSKQTPIDFSKQNPTDKGIHRIRHCWFWAFFKAVTARQNHRVFFSKHFTIAKPGKKHFSAVALWLSDSDGVFPKHLLQECSELQGFVSWYSPHHQAGFALHSLTTLAHKLCRSNIKSSFRSQQPHISKATMSTLLLQTRLSSSTFLLNLLAPKSLCPKRLYLFPTPFLPQFLSL